MKKSYKGISMALVLLLCLTCIPALAMPVYADGGVLIETPEASIAFMGENYEWNPNTVILASNPAEGTSEVPVTVTTASEAASMDYNVKIEMSGSNLFGNALATITTKDANLPSPTSGYAIFIIDNCATKIEMKGEKNTFGTYDGTRSTSKSLFQFDCVGGDIELECAGDLEVNLAFFLCLNNFIYDVDCKIAGDVIQNGGSGTGGFIEGGNFVKAEAKSYDIEAYRFFNAKNGTIKATGGDMDVLGLGGGVICKADDSITLLAPNGHIDIRANDSNCSNCVCLSSYGEGIATINAKDDITFTNNYGNSDIFSAKEIEITSLKGNVVFEARKETAINVYAGGNATISAVNGRIITTNSDAGSFKVGALGNDANLSMTAKEIAAENYYGIQGFENVSLKADLVYVKAVADPVTSCKNVAVSGLSAKKAKSVEFISTGNDAYAHFFTTSKAGSLSIAAKFMTMAAPGGTDDFQGRFGWKSSSYDLDFDVDTGYIVGKCDFYLDGEKSEWHPAIPSTIKNITGDAITDAAKIIDLTSEGAMIISQPLRGSYVIVDADTNTIYPMGTSVLSSAIIGDGDINIVGPRADINAMMKGKEFTFDTFRFLTGEDAEILAEEMFDVLYAKYSMLAIAGGIRTDGTVTINNMVTIVTGLDGVALDANVVFNNCQAAVVVANAKLPTVTPRAIAEGKTITINESGRSVSLANITMAELVSTESVVEFQSFANGKATTFDGAGFSFVTSRKESNHRSSGGGSSKTTAPAVELQSEPEKIQLVELQIPTTPEARAEALLAVSSMTDVQNHWAQADIATMVQNKIFTGVSATDFAPNSSATRNMIFTVLARLAGQDTTAPAGQSWFAPGAEWVKKVGISDALNGNIEVSREEFVTMLYRLEVLLNGGIKSEKSSSQIAGFGDGGNVSPFARDAVEWALEQGILTGTYDAEGNLIINPQGNATRAELCAMLNRYLK